jgi:predicted acetylornithine/succinylornithine family transaminase
VELEKKYFLQTGHRRLEVTIVRGEGSHVWDDKGREYLDFVAGWAALSLGHCHPVVVGALREQAETLLLATNDTYTLPQVQLAEILIQNSPFDRAYFQNSGTEAVEVAIKLARKFGKLHRNGAYEFICAHRAFHGRTLGALAATGHQEYQEPFQPMPPGFAHVPFNDLAALKAATTDKTCAVVLEPVQGEGGVYVADEAYLAGVRSWCDQRGLLLILDEVQTGMGRTGKLFAFQHYGIEPDIITLGKGLGGGVPVSAILAKERAAVFGHGDHGTTFGGNPLLCAVALAVVRWMLDQDLPTHVAELGDHLVRRLDELKARCDGIKEVRGKGLLVAMEFDRDVAPDLVQACVANGLLTNPVRPNALRFMPPLTVTKEEIDQAMDILAVALGQTLGTRLLTPA